MTLASSFAVGASFSQPYGKWASTLVIATTPDEIRLIVNGAERRIPAGWTLADLLASLALDARTVVIERNGTILRDRASFAKLELGADDSIEIVHFVGGG
jgi:thiamine biosynthesis protein ThiS